MHRIYLAFLCFFRVLFGKALPEELAPKPALPPAPKAEAPKLPAPKKDATPGALQLLGMFQREGRLVDFLNEPIDTYEDADIGAAVRDIHKGCRKVLLEHFGVEPVLEGDENESITVDDNFDPARIRLTGNVGKPPFKGVLRHHGWKAAKISLPVVTDGIDASIVAPAEVELP
jgi:hypothetical protein